MVTRRQARSTPQGATAYLQADVRDPAAIITGARKILDLDRPVALSLVALLHFIPDTDDAHDPVGRLLAELSPGSYLTMTYATADFTPEDSAAATAKLKAAGVTLALRSREEFSRFFDGPELVDPGVQIVHQWHPELGEPVPGQDDGVIPGYAAVARKP
ncbi:SAM-dependent methyltransferase [Streptomyces collinus]|uniref:SAM-dependent methyltransferase n=1 Tax=Streptomyces collinus TaxID=42684 RepID=UPI0036B447B7